MGKLLFVSCLNPQRPALCRPGLYGLLELDIAVNNIVKKKTLFRHSID